ncbi:FecR family protein [Sphingomonas sp. PAMC 26605]|uniref:FecR family protein n=1 Tax=Sphingomonas sp. PAMC 26605 TaxID=1112214 RepID=UPI00026CCBB8|nr:FecR domain-containing protein [Sphingomonas sp. PAMC 26605]
MPHRETASQIEDDATLWAAKAERGLTAEEQGVLDQWLAGDSRRLGAFVRAQAAWIHAERAMALGTMPESATPPSEAPVPRDAPRPRVLNRRMALAGGGALAASLAAAYVLGSDRTRMLESGVGEIRHIALRGGSVLMLDTDTRVDVTDTADDGKLELVRGKLFLTIPRARAEPLIVRTGDLVLQAAGGAFSLQNVLAAPIIALVTEGQAIVSQSQGMLRGTRTVTLEKNHALTLLSNRPLLAEYIRPVDTAQRAQLLAWRDGMLSFGGERLADAVRAFDRYGETRIVVAPELARQKVVGLFKADDPQGFATAVAASFGGVVTRQGDSIRISGKPRAA